MLYGVLMIGLVLHPRVFGGSVPMLDLGMTQKQVSEQSGVSIITIRNFENGKLRNISMGTFIELLRAIDFMQGLDDVLPEIPVSPYELEKIQQGKRKRVRHAK